MLTKWLIRSYKTMMEVFAWILLILFAGIGLFVGIEMDNMGLLSKSISSDMYPLIGMGIGILIGLLFEALLLAPALVLFDIHSKVEAISRK